MSIVNSYLDRTKAAESGLPNSERSWHAVQLETACLKENWCESFCKGDLCTEHSKYII